MTDIVETARRHLGYRALPLRNSVYGVSNRDWNGSFVRHVYGEAGRYLPTGDTVELLARLTKARRLWDTPRNGDLVFYAFPAEDGEPTGQPHVGIVTDASRWKSDRSFLAVEAQVRPGETKADQTPNGVFERRRYHTDVLTFARPKFTKPSEKVKRSHVKISVSQLEPGKRHKMVEHVQIALGAVVGLRDAERGLYDGRTRSAMAAYQRRLGRVGREANGLPDSETLFQLGAETGEFEARS